jgi:hypothetical protein
MVGFNSFPFGTSPAQTPTRKRMKKQEANEPKVEFSSINKALVYLKRYPFVVAPENSPIISFLPFSSFPSLKNMSVGGSVFRAGSVFLRDDILSGHRVPEKRCWREVGMNLRPKMLWGREVSPLAPNIDLPSQEQKAIGTKWIIKYCLVIGFEPQPHPN